MNYRKNAETLFLFSLADGGVAELLFLFAEPHFLRGCGW